MVLALEGARELACWFSFCALQTGVPQNTLLFCQFQLENQSSSQFGTRSAATLGHAQKFALSSSFDFCLDMRKVAVCLAMNLMAPLWQFEQKRPEAKSYGKLHVKMALCLLSMLLHVAHDNCRFFRLKRGASERASRRALCSYLFVCVCVCMLWGRVDTFTLCWLVRRRRAKMATRAFAHRTSHNWQC